MWSGGWTSRDKVAAPHLAVVSTGASQRDSAMGLSWLFSLHVYSCCMLLLNPLTWEPNLRLPEILLLTQLRQETTGSAGAEFLECPEWLLTPVPV